MLVRTHRSSRYCIAAFALALASCGGGGSGGGGQAGPTPTAVAGVQRTTVTWAPVAGATSYNLYWSSSSMPTKATANRVVGAISPFQHEHLLPGLYRYMVTSVGPDGESGDSSVSGAAVEPVGFVTSTSGTGDLHSWGADAGGHSGLAAADSICQARAQAGELEGTFVAWLSDSADDAYCRIEGFSGKKASNCGQATLPASAGPWIRTDASPFLGPLADVVDDTVVYTPARFDELGHEVSNASYFTATWRDGTGFVSGSHEACTDWTSTVGTTTTFVSIGSTESAGSGWTDAAEAQTTHCATSLRLLCLQAEAGVASTPVAPSGKLVFVTSEKGYGDLGAWSETVGTGKTGIAAGDAICQGRAAAAGLANAGAFKVWLSDASTNATSLITSDGPWFRRDGIQVVDHKADLLAGKLFTAIAQTETGSYVMSSGAWTGTKQDGTKASNTCNGWTDATATYRGNVGISSSAGGQWTESVDAPCNLAQMALYCFED